MKPKVKCTLGEPTTTKNYPKRQINIKAELIKIEFTKQSRLSYSMSSLRDTIAPRKRKSTLTSLINFQFQA